MEKRKFNRLYIHVPFCASKCGYCAFYSEPSASDAMIDAYFAGIEREFAANFADCAELDSIFIGGGTPTFLSSHNLRRLISLINANFALSDDAEITIEANPETLDAEKVEITANFANRISLGIQSFNDDYRKILGRNCSSEAIENAFELLEENFSGRISCDLIYGIPGQGVNEFLVDLQNIVQRHKLITHISAYSLTYEEGTRLAESQQEQQDADVISAECAYAAEKFLECFGIKHYEISNYALPGFECRHNLEIWFGDTYLGCGPAASSFDGKDRYTNASSLSEWLSRGEPERDILPPEKRAAEILATGLRTSRGWDGEMFFRRTGYRLSEFEKEIAEAESAGLLIYDDGKLIPTENGLSFWDDLAMIFC